MQWIRTGLGALGGIAASTAYHQWAKLRWRKMQNQRMEDLRSRVNAAWLAAAKVNVREWVKASMAEDPEKSTAELEAQIMEAMLRNLAACASEGGCSGVYEGQSWLLRVHAKVDGELSWGGEPPDEGDTKKMGGF